MHSAFPAFWVHHDDKGRWSWKFAAVEGDFTAQSANTYASQRECLEAIRVMVGTKNLAVFSTLEEAVGDDRSQASQSGERSGRQTLSTPRSFEPQKT